MKKTIDLRSDTVTKPSKKMRQIISQAQVGDDVYGEDPSVIRLEQKVAHMAKKESALFVSSGTLSNLLALLSHCERGDEYICGQDAHIYKYEAGGGAVVGSIQPQPIEFEKDATLSFKKIKAKIKPEDNHFAKTKLLCLENTHHGQVLPLEYLKEAKKFAKKNGLLLHLDGARVFNAVVEQNLKLSDITKYFDSISICLSKGLGAPVGSVLIGSKNFIKKARHYRKMLGGGLRQSGVLAAAGSYALENNISGLKRDHKGLCQLLTLLQTKLTMIEQELPANYNLISDAINYIESYVRRYHHPKEDIIYHYIIDQQLDMEGHFIESCQEHQQFEPITKKLKASLQSILLDVVIPREIFIGHLRAFIDAEQSHVKNEDEIKRYTKRVKEIIANNKFVYKDDIKIKLKFSAGVTFRENYENSEDAIKKADELLYKAKHQGKDQVLFDNGVVI